MSQKFQLVKARVPKGSVYHVLTLPETSGNPAGWAQPVRALRRQWRQLQFAAPGSWHAFVGAAKRQDQQKRKEYKDEQKSRDLDDESRQDEFQRRYGGDKGNALSLFDARNEHNVRGVHNYPGPSVLFVLDPVTSTMNVLPVESFVNMTPFVYTKPAGAAADEAATADGAAAAAAATAAVAAAAEAEEESEQRPLARFHLLGGEEFKQQKSKARALVSKDYVPLSMQIASMRTARALGDSARDLDGGRPKGSGRGRRGGDDGDSGDGGFGGGYGGDDDDDDDGFGRRRRGGRRWGRRGAGSDDDDFGGDGGDDYGGGSESDGDPERDGELLDAAVEAGVDRDDINAFDDDDAADDSERRFLKYAAEGRRALAAESAATKARKARLLQRMRDGDALGGADDGGEQGEDPDYDYAADQDVLMTDLLDTMDDRASGSDEDGDGDGDGGDYGSDDDASGPQRAGPSTDVLLESDDDDDGEEEGSGGAKRAKRPVATSPAAAAVPGVAGAAAAGAAKRPRSESPVAGGSGVPGAAEAKKMRGVSPSLDVTEDSIRRRLSVCDGRMRAKDFINMYKHSGVDTKTLIATINRVARIEKVKNDTWIVLRQ